MCWKNSICTKLVFSLMVLTIWKKLINRNVEAKWSPTAKLQGSLQKGHLEWGKRFGYKNLELFEGSFLVGCVIPECSTLVT
jgi:hypothetical protein